MDKLIGLKEIIIPILASLGIGLLVDNNGQILISIESNSIGFYFIIVLFSFMSIYSLSKVRSRIKNYKDKFTEDNYSEIRKKCDERKR